jgi:sugar phosphate isomerase/epimerase
MRKYLRGVFLNVSRFEPRVWERQLVEIDRLPHLDHIELWLEYIPKRQELSVLRNMFSGRRTIMHGPFINMSLATEWEQLAQASLDRCGRAIEVASYIGSQVVTFHAGTYPVFDTKDAALARLADRFSKFANLSRPVVTLENMPVRGGASIECLSRTEDLESLVVLLPHLKLTLDVGHCLQNHDEVESFIKAHALSIVNIHLHDGIKGGKAHMRLGSGQLDLGGFLQAISESSYAGYVGMETLSVEDTAHSWEVLLDAETQLFDEDLEGRRHKEIAVRKSVVLSDHA